MKFKIPFQINIPPFFKKAIPVLIGLSLIWYAAYSMLLDRTGFLNQSHILEQNKSLKKQIDSLKSNLIIRNQELMRLQKDSFYLESLARVQCGLVKPHEKSLQIFSTIKANDSLHP